MNNRKLRLESLEERALLAVVAGGFEQAAELAAPTESVTWVVNTIEDPTNWDTTDDILSLREAIGSAAEGDLIVFASEMSGMTITLNGKQLEVLRGITIDATSIDGITISGDGRSRVFYVGGGNSDSPVEFIKLTITGGYTKYVSGDSVTNGEGGGVYNDGVLTMINSIISGNYAGTYGGGIFNYYGTLTLTNSTISGNTSGAGGIYNNKGNIAISCSSVFENKGGGIISYKGTVTILNSAIFHNNNTQHGGGIYSSGTLKITQSTIWGNEASYGGGIYSESSGVSLNNCTILGNIASVEGGGIYNNSSVTCYNSIIAMNTADNDVSDIYSYEKTTKGYDTLSSYNGWNQATNCLVYDPTRPLVVDIDNGNLELALGSQAVNCGDNDYVTTETDLAGNPRIVADIVDLGAYEYQPETPSTIVTTLDDVIDVTDELISLREAVTLYAEEGDTITFAPELAGGTIVLGGSDIEITKSITIDALETDGITIDANGKSRIFFMNTGRNPNPVELINLNLTGGNPGDGDGAAIYIHGGILHVTDSFIYGNSTGGNGGGICNHWGALEVTNSTIVENYARNAGGIMSYSGSLTVANCTISDNRARGWDGGGIRAYGSATVTDTIVSGNYANRSGGGIMASDSLTVINTLISGNVAKYGGGVWSNTEELIITSSIIQNNSASLGGGFYNERKLSLVNCLTCNNTSQEHGGGLYNTGNLTLINTTVADNRTSANDSHGIYNEGSSYLFNSIIAQNESNDIVNVADKEIYAYSTLSSFEDWTESENSILYDPSIPLFSDEFGSDYSISGDSQAVNAGDNSYVTWDTDLSGNSRIVGEVVDLGAYEYPDYKQLESPLILTGVGSVYVSYGANRHQIIWNEVENASGYELAYSEDGGNSWDSIEISETNYVVTGLTYGKDVTYRVRALRNGLFITSEWSAEKSFNVCPMDINGDGDISGPDRLILSSAWLAEEGDSRYQYYCDLDGDGNVANRDRLALSVNWLMETEQEGLLYPRPLAADAVFAEFESADISLDPDTF